MGKLKITGNSLSFAGGSVQIGTTENGWMAETKGCHVNGSNNEDALSLARRLVAAYNACEGIETESLELQIANGGISNFCNLVNELERMKAQNAQLIEALEGLYSLVETKWLVRNTEDDSKPGFAIRQLEPMSKLQAAKHAIAAATTSV